MQLLNTYEKKVLEHVVGVLCSYNVTFEQFKNAEGYYHWVMKP